jgi:hypothetical protein
MLFFLMLLRTILHTFTNFYNKGQKKNCNHGGNIVTN